VNRGLVGAFVIVLGALLVAGALWLASGGASHRTQDPYWAVEEESVAGLNLNAPVKFNGVDVGRVREIRLDPTNPNRVVLLFAIDRGTPITTDTVAVLKTQGLTGIAYVELSGGDARSLPLRATEPGNYPVIRTKPSLAARLENVLTTVLVKLDRTSTNIDAFLSEANQRALSSALADIARVSQVLASRSRQLDAGIVAAAQTAENAARVSAQLGPVIERVGRSADALQQFGTSAAQASADAGRTVGRVGAGLLRVADETLPELQRLLGELDALAGSLRRLSDQTERNPSGLLFGRRPTVDGPGETPAGEGAR
jgi:phospholipid/cholesterol/gamma-HCH transport system substrate-binding protein